MYYEDERKMYKKLFLYADERQDRRRVSRSNRCDECYNIVYNSAPLYLGTQKVKIQKLSPKRLRIRFGAERKEEVKKVLEQAIDAFGEKPQFDYTQEHFKRGVL